MSCILKNELFEPIAYHNQKVNGWFSIHNKTEKCLTSEYFELPLMPNVIDLVDPKKDTYISQGEFFRKSRQVVNLARIGLSFVDLDTYHIPGLSNNSVETNVFNIIGFCDLEGIPRPSLIVYSGRGYQLKWLFLSAIPRAALPRWNLLQATLIDKLKTIGADPAARDAARILRLVQTVNTKSGEVARVVHVEEHDGNILRYDFNYLCDFLFPLTQDELKAKRESRLNKPRKISVFFSGQKLAWDRLEDLRRLYEIRGGVPVGERMTNLFWRLNFLLLSRVTDSKNMWTEALALGKEIDDSWSFQNGELGTLFRKAQSYEKGEKIDFDGRQYSPLYTPRNDTLINIFGISPDEEKNMVTIISHEEKYRRRVEKRRQNGLIPRQEYENNSLSRLKPWDTMGISRRTYYSRIQKEKAQDNIESIHLSSRTDLCNIESEERKAI